jgi:hypothetical protein
METFLRPFAKLPLGLPKWTSLRLSLAEGSKYKSMRKNGSASPTHTGARLGATLLLLRKIGLGFISLL